MPFQGLGGKVALYFRTMTIQTAALHNLVPQIPIGYIESEACKFMSA